MNLGEAIKSARIKVGLTPKEVYTRAGITQGFYSGVESGDNKPSLDTLNRISGALGLPMFFIIWGATERQGLNKKERVWYDKLSPAIEGVLEELTKTK